MFDQAYFKHAVLSLDQANGLVKQDTTAAKEDEHHTLLCMYQYSDSEHEPLVFNSSYLCVFAEQSDHRRSESVCVPTGFIQQQHGPRQATSQPLVGGQHHRGQSVTPVQYV